MAVVINEEKLKAEMDTATRNEWENIPRETRFAVMGAMSRSISDTTNITNYLLAAGIGAVIGRSLKRK